MRVGTTPQIAASPGAVDRGCLLSDFLGTRGLRAERAVEPERDRRADRARSKTGGPAAGATQRSRAWPGQIERGRRGPLSLLHGGRYRTTSKRVGVKSLICSGRVGSWVVVAWGSRSGSSSRPFTSSGSMSHSAWYGRQSPNQVSACSPGLDAWGVGRSRHWFDGLTDVLDLDLVLGRWFGRGVDSVAG